MVHGYAPRNQRQMQNRLTSTDDGNEITRVQLVFLERHWMKRPPSMFARRPMQKKYGIRCYQCSNSPLCSVCTRSSIVSSRSRKMALLPSQNTHLNWQICLMTFSQSFGSIIRMPRSRYPCSIIESSERSVLNTNIIVRLGIAFLKRSKRQSF